jgi:membrane protease YdiL (CAAX protease family)
MVPMQRIRPRTIDLLATPAALVTCSYLAALAIAEATLLTSGLVAGALAHGVLMVALIAHYIAAPRVAYRRLLLAFALPSLMRLVGLTVPIANTSPLVWIVAAGVPTLLAAILCARAIDAFPSAWLRWPGRDIVAQLGIAASGLTEGILAYLILRPSAVIGQLDALGITGAVVALGVFAAFTEELVFRGIIQRVAAETFSSRSIGLVLSTGLFTLMYVGSLSVPFVVLMLAVGLLFGWIAQETRSLWGVIGAHALMTIGLLAIWPFILR